MRRPRSPPTVIVAAGRPVERAEQVQQRALPAARRAGDRHELALLDPERDIDERGDRPVLERARDVVGNDLGPAVPRGHFAVTG